MILDYIFIFITGLVAGSFLDVCVYRIPNKQSIITPLSYCPQCGCRIQSHDLIPLFSYFILKGKCRNCKTQIAVRSLIIELLTGFVYLIVFKKFGWTKELLVYLFLSSLLIVVSFIDLYRGIIPDRLVILGVLIGIPLILWTGKSIIESFLGSILSFFIMVMIVFISRGGMGGGDVKFVGMLGLYLGSKLIIVFLFLTFLIGALGGIILILLRIKSKKDFIPFGPFIALGAMLTILFASNLYNLYLIILQR